MTTLTPTERSFRAHDGYLVAMAQPERSNSRGIFGRIAAGASDRVLDIVDPNLVLEYVDVDGLLARVDVNALLDRVDVDQLLDQVDVNQLLDRVDVNRLMDRVDIDGLMDQVDVPRLVDRAGIPDIVAESTGHLTGSALDMFRRPIVGLDEIIIRAANRLLRRPMAELPQGPGDLVEWVEERRGFDSATKTGRYAGPLTRLLAVMVDFFVVTFGLTAIFAGGQFLIGLFLPDFAFPTNQGFIYAGVLAGWAFIYLWTSWAVFGKSVGMMMLGVRVVSSDGSLVLRGRQPLIRVLTFPLSILILGLGLIGAIFNRRRQTWHDRLARTSVVYDWGSRSVQMPTPLADYLTRKGANPYAEAPE